MRYLMRYINHLMPLQSITLHFPTVVSCDSTPGPLQQIIPASTNHPPLQQIMATLSNMALYGAVAVVLLILLGPAPGAHAQTQPLCNQSQISALTSDCQDVASFLSSLGTKTCANTNGVASKCTTMKKIGTCTASICGAVAGQPCNVVSGYVSSLATTCATTFNGSSHSSGLQIMNEDSGLTVEIF